MRLYKLVRKYPDGKFYDTFSGSVEYEVDKATIDPTSRGLSVCRTRNMALNKPMPENSVGLKYPGFVLVCDVNRKDIIGDYALDDEFFQVSKLIPIYISLDNIHPDCLNKGFSSRRFWVAWWWTSMLKYGGFKVVNEFSENGELISKYHYFVNHNNNYDDDDDNNQNYRIEYKPTLHGTKYKMFRKEQ